MGVVDTGLGRIGVEESGTGGTPLVLLHGVGSTKRAWRPQLSHFSATRRTVALDYPGYGESELRPNATRDDFASAMLAALDCLSIDRAHICGLSLGGIIAVAMHAEAPQRCASLILADSFALHPDGPAIHDRSVAAARTLGMRGLADARVDALLAQPAEPAVRAEVIDTMSGIDPTAYALGAAAVWLADQRDRVAAIACPTLILCGTEDRITPPALSEDLKDRIPHAAYVEIAGAGHLSNLERPAVFNRVLEAFLAGVED